MKKFLLALILGLFWCNVGIASEAGGVREPGHDAKVTLISQGKEIVKDALK